MLYILSAMDLQATYTYLLEKFLSMDFERLPGIFEAGHGKGEPDGIGGALKRQADSLVLVQRQDITYAKDLVEGLNALQTSLKLFTVADDMVEKKANELPKNIESVPETMRTCCHVCMMSPGQLLACVYQDDL